MAVTALAAGCRAEALRGDALSAQTQALDQPVPDGCNPDHASLTSRQGRHRAVTLAGGIALPLLSRSR